jgi:hypothetical protein
VRRVVFSSLTQFNTMNALTSNGSMFVATALTAVGIQDETVAVPAQDRIDQALFVDSL